MKKLASLVLVIAMFLGLCPTTIGAALTLPQSAVVQALAETSGDQSYEESLEETTDDYSYEQSSEEIVESSEVIVESSEDVSEDISSEESSEDVSEDISSEESYEDLEESINYSFDEATGTLAVTGNGAMADYTSASQTPWYSYQSSITKVVIEEGVTYVGDYAFSDCTALTSVSLPQSLIRIGNYAFYFCNNLADIAIPAAVEYIGDFAFYSCAKLTSVVMPEGLTYIGISAFEYCITLATVTITQSLTAISGYAFNNCNALNQVCYAGGIPQWDAVEIAAGNTPLSTAGIIYNYVPGTTVLAKGSLDTLNWHLDSNGLLVISGTGAMLDFTSPSTNAWRAHESSIKEVYIKNGVTSIGSYAFYYCSRLTSVTISDSVTSIGSNAFSYCSGLTSITIPDSVTSIGSYAFYRCYALTSITIPDSVTSIGYDAFYGCSGLTKVNITDVAAWCAVQFKTSDANPLYYAKNLYLNGSLVTNLVIPTGVTSISPYAFHTCTSLTSVTVTDSVTSIGYDAFYGCSGLTSITIPDSVTAIGDSAFYNCDSITSITIPDSVTSIGSNAFCGTGYYNDSTNWVKDVLYIGNHLIEAKYTLSGAYTIKSGTITVANEAFSGYSSVTGVTIPDSVVSIGSNAFNGCSKLTSVTIGAGVTAIGSKAFYGCPALTKVNITDVAAWCAIQFEYYDDNPLYYAKKLYLNGSLVTKLVIPADVTSITPYAFYNCTSVTSVSIPGTVSSIGSSAFYGCTNLKNVYYGGSSTQWSAIYIGSSNSSLTNATKNYNYFVTLSFEADHGSLSFTSLDVYPTTELSTVTFPTVTAHPNFRFVGWDNISGTITQDTVITAIFVRVSASVSFIGVNGEVLSQQTVPYGQAATVPQIPPREGYNIIGWKDQNGNIISDFSSVREDMTLTASYEQIMLKVYFAAENGSLSYTETTVPYGTDIADIICPTVTPHTGYNFVAWDKPEGTVKEEITLTARFALKTYTLSFTGVYGETLSQQTVTHGYAAIAPAAPVYEGYEFAGWMDKAGNMIDSFDIITGDISVLACYKDLNYDYPTDEETSEEESEDNTESSAPNGDTTRGDNLLLNKYYTVTYDGAFMEDDGVKATDGKFRGDGTSAWNGDSKGDASVEWMGTGKTVTYTFTFDAPVNLNEIVFKRVRIASNRQFGTLIINDNLVFLSNEVVKTPVADAPLYSDAQVDQFFDISVSVELNGITELKIQLITDGYCCQYDEIEAYGLSHTVNFVAEHGTMTGDTQLSVSPGTELSTLTYPTVTPDAGYVFLGWDKTEGAVNENTTVKAIFGRIWSTVEFKDADGTVISTQTVGKGYASIVPQAPVHEGYTVAGWANENGVANTARITNNMSLTPIYEIIMVKVNFVSQMGTLSYTETTVPYGTDIKDIPYPTATPDAGYNLIGWDITEGTVKEEITLTAQFALKVYVVSFKAIDGSIISEQRILHGFDAIAPKAPAFEGYDFIGWAAENGVMTSKFNNITANASYTACYKESVVEEEVKHFEFAEGADATNVVVSTKTEQVYFKAGGMSAEELSAMFTGAEISITKANGAAVTGGSLVGTGCVITSTINGVTESRTIVVLGDINGDGKVNATDYAQVLNHAKGKVQLSGIKLTAANVAAAASATINAADYGQVLGFALGRTTKFNTAVE